MQLVHIFPDIQVNEGYFDIWLSSRYKECNRVMFLHFLAGHGGPHL